MKLKIKRNVSQHLSWFLLLLILFTVFCEVKAGATFNCETVQSGTWTDPAVWTACDGGYPNSIDKHATIKNGHSMQFNFSSVQINGLQMEAASEIIGDNTNGTHFITASASNIDTSLGSITSGQSIYFETQVGDINIGAVQTLGLNDRLTLKSARDVLISQSLSGVNVFQLFIEGTDPTGQIKIYNSITTESELKLQLPVEIFDSVALSAHKIEMEYGLILGNHSLELNTNSNVSFPSYINGSISGVASNIINNGTGYFRFTGEILSGVSITFNGGGVIIMDTLHDDLVLNGDAVLGGLGQINGTLNLNDDSSLIPGLNSGVAAYPFEVGNLVMSDQASLIVPSLSIAQDYVLLRVQGDATLNGRVVFPQDPTFSSGEEYVIIEKTSPGPVSGVFTDVNEGDVVEEYFAVSYLGGDGNDVIASSICGNLNWVTNNFDSGPGSFRNAANTACLTASEIHFDDSYEVTLNSSIVINHGQFLDINFDSGLSQVFTSSGNHPAIMVESGATSRFQSVTFRNITSDQGAVVNNGELTFHEAYFANNTNTGISGAGAITNNGGLSVSSSAFYQNNGLQGGAIYSLFGAFINSSSFYQNGHLITGQGGAIYNAGQFEMWNVSILDSGDGGAHVGNSVYSVNDQSYIRFVNTVIANNNLTSSECYSARSIDYSFEDTTWIQDGSCDAPLSGDPQLGAWGDYGGYAPAIPLQPLSPLINSGSNSFCGVTVNIVDQLGNFRINGISCDIGAVEFQDAVSPQVNSVNIEDQNINVCGNSSILSNELKVTYNEPVLDAETSGYYEVLHAGADQSFLTPDDQLINVLSASSDFTHPYPTITLQLENQIPEGLVRLLVDGEITDEFYLNLNEGDGHQHPFRVELDNAFIQGHFDDCEGQDPFALWQINSTTPVNISADKDNSNVSSSLQTSINHVNAFSIGQCVNLNAAIDLNMSLFIKSEKVNPSLFLNQGLTHSVAMSCTLYDGVDCSGSLSGYLGTFNQNVIIDSAWQEIEMDLGRLDAAVMSANCEFNITTNDTELTDIQIDGLRLQSINDLIFKNGYDVD